MTALRYPSTLPCRSLIRQPFSMSSSESKAQAQPYAGGMYWKRQGDYEYLVKTLPDNRQQRVGPRSADTEKIHEEFTSRKRVLEARLKSLREALTDAERLNNALKTPRPQRGGVGVADPRRRGCTHH